MSWTDIDLTNVSPVLEPLPEQEFKWQLLPGAKANDFDPNRVDVKAAVAEGTFAGRQIFFSYPDPAKYDWAPRIFMRMVQALGVDILPGEGPVAYLNRAAGNYFQAPVKHRKVETEGAEKPVVKTDMVIFNVKPAA